MNKSLGVAWVVVLCILAGWLSFGFGLLAISPGRVAKAAARSSPPPTAAPPCRV
jgi:hypothetical protein